MTIIAAIDKNNSIGKDNQLLWHLPDDLKRFKTLTRGHAVIMGRKTFESLRRPLPDRVNIVISGNSEYQVPEGVILVSSLEDAIAQAKETDPEPFIIGGGNIYKQSLDKTDKLEITLVHTQMKDADTYFPEIDLTKWKKVSDEYHSKDEKHQFDFSFQTYSRK